MIIAKSKLTARGQISVPAEVCQRRGEPQDGQVVVRRVGRYTSEEIHRALFPARVPGHAPDVKEAVRKYTRKKHASR